MSQVSKFPQFSSENLFSIYRKKKMTGLEWNIDMPEWDKYQDMYSRVLADIRELGARKKDLEDIRRALLHNYEDTRSGTKVPRYVHLEAQDAYNRAAGKPVGTPLPSGFWSPFGNAGPRTYFDYLKAYEENKRGYFAPDE